jgi:hypothetical protein
MSHVKECGRWSVVGKNCSKLEILPFLAKLEFQLAEATMQIDYQLPTTNYGS